MKINLTKTLLKAKVKATMLHLILSLIIFSAIVAWQLLILYPSFFFGMSGGMQGLALMFGVDVVLGPLLTFMVFNPGKRMREIVTDFCVIAVVQIAALSYGLHTVYMEHPKLVVVYDMGASIVMNYREVQEDEEMKKIDLSGITRVENMPFVGMIVKNGQTQYKDIKSLPDLIGHVDKIVRNEIAKIPEEKAELEVLEKQHGKIFVLSVAGKYKGAYVILDKDFNYIARIGEKPMT